MPGTLDKLEPELKQGHRIEIMRGDTLIAELRAPKVELAEGELPEMPDFMARMKQMWGDRTFGDSAKWIREDRDAGY